MITSSATTTKMTSETDTRKLRVLVVDDSVVYRKVVRDALARLPSVEIVGVAANGKLAIEKIPELNPDMVTLDFEMPEMDGLGVLRWLKQNKHPSKAVMISALTTEGATATLKALHEGAFDFIVKPSGSNVEQNLEDLSVSLGHHVEAVRSLRYPQVSRLRKIAPSIANPAAATPVANRILPGRQTISIVGIGISTGGPDALRMMLPRLPGNLPVPVVIVQHMPPVFTKSLADSLNKSCALNISEGQDGQVVRPGEAVIAPGGRHMKVHRTAAGHAQLELTDDPAVQSCRPSVDYMLFSLLESFGEKTLSVIMTGMGYDGVEGCRRLRKIGGPVMAQDERSCVVFGMPRKLVEEQVADIVSPLNDIAANIVQYVGGKGRV